jgi:hypothetical protein
MLDSGIMRNGSVMFLKEVKRQNGEKSLDGTWNNVA